MFEDCSSYMEEERQTPQHGSRGERVLQQEQQTPVLQSGGEALLATLPDEVAQRAEVRRRPVQLPGHQRVRKCRRKTKHRSQKLVYIFFLQITCGFLAVPCNSVYALQWNTNSCGFRAIPCRFGSQNITTYIDHSIHSSTSNCLESISEHVKTHHQI